jgi:beta-glucosidase/6-phospho-beta-glucosidase/beta-galactosidase
MGVSPGPASRLSAGLDSARRRAVAAVHRALRRQIPPFPPEFLLGTGTSDHQCEAFDPRYPDIWDVWEAAHAPGLPGVAPYEARGRATDFWHRYPDDVRLARSLGCNAFRFSIAWARVEPEPGQFSDENLRHYRDLADTICAAGMEPVVTLMHFVWPKHVEERGGLRAAEFPRWFGEYAERVREALGDRCRYWITINEPNALLFGYLKPFWMRHYAWPPGLPPEATEAESMRATAEVIRNLFLAHRAARLVLRSGEGGERRLVSANSYYLGLPTHFWRLPFPLMQWVDWRAGSEKGWSEEDWELVEGRLVLRSTGRSGAPPRAAHGPQHAPAALLAALAAGSRRVAGLLGMAKSFAVLSSFTTSNWWQLGMRGRLPDFLCPPECVAQQDYVAFDYYFGTQFLGKIGTLLDVIERRYDRAPIWAAGLSDALRYFAGMFPGLPLFVIENGFAGRPDRVERAYHLRDHLRQVLCARADGLNVVGYLAWSLTTNREWGLPAGPHSDFGLFHVDLDGDPALRRHPTPASAAYRSIIEHRRA